MKYFERHISEVIKRQIRLKPALIVTGPRQVGKSTILMRLIEGVEYITLDDMTLRTMAKEEPKNFLAINKPPIIIDEIQKAPNIFDEIKMKIDANLTPAQYFLTGSHKYSLMEGVQESLAGRAGIINMLGLSYREIMGIKVNDYFLPTEDHLQKMRVDNPFNFDIILNRIHKGSYPELYKNETDLEDWRDYYSSYVQTYIDSDVKDKIDKENTQAFMRFIIGCASLSGEVLNYSTLAEYCGMSVKTAQNWLSLLLKSGHVYLLQPYSANIGKRLSKAAKLYFLDTGLICYLNSWNTPQQLVNGSKWGHIFESYVISEIIKSYYNKGIIMPKLSYYRDSNKVEIDLLIEEADTIYPIEIKSSSNPNKNMVKAFKVLSEIKTKSIAKGGLICMYDRLLTLTDDVYIIPVNLI